MTNTQIETVSNTMSKILEEISLLEFTRDSLISRDNVPHSEAICCILSLVSEGLSRIVDDLDYLERNSRSKKLPELVPAM